MTAVFLKFRWLIAALIALVLVAFIGGKLSSAPEEARQSVDENLAPASSSTVTRFEPSNTEGKRDRKPTERAQARHGSPQVFGASGIIPVSDLPVHLHAKSAIQISDSGDLGDFLASDSRTFSFPLSETEVGEFEILKRVEKANGSTVLFGSLAEERSHFSLVIEDGNLVSGTVSMLDSGDAYVLSVLPDGRLALSLTDPSVELPLCGCPDCIGDTP